MSDIHVMNPVLAQTEPEAHTFKLAGIPSALAIIWEGAKIEDFERFQTAPNRIKALVRLTSVESFCEFVKRFASPATSVYLDVYGGERSSSVRDNIEVAPSFVAVIDHPDKDAPAWQGFRAKYEPRLSMEWKAWRELHDRGAIGQVELVEFLEDHVNDVSTPTPAAVLTAASEFEAVETHKYVSHRNMDNGHVAITYNKGGDTATVTFPHRLTLDIPIVEGGLRRAIECRLRYRTSEGSIRFLFQIAQDPDRLERDAYRQEADYVEQHCEGLKLYEGVNDTPLR